MAQASFHHPGHDGFIPHDHEDGHGHDHVHDETGAAIWAADHVQLTTIGIDIGSSTAHFMFARVHMQRLTTALTSRFVVAGREIVWRSPVLLTPYRPDGTIDAGRLARFFEDGFREAGIARQAVDTGAIILTGEALKRGNARAIADLFAAESGKFVCALAGHHMECVLGAHGSGAVALSEQRHTILLNVDIGGGTTKFTLIDDGKIIASTAIAVGVRLLVTDREGCITRLDAPALELARQAGITLAVGADLTEEMRARLVARMVELVIAMIRREPPDARTEPLLLTAAWPPHSANVPLDAVTVSGGVAEYLYDRETAEFGDLGPAVARELRRALGEDVPLLDPGQGIRATVIGAGQFSVQVSGNTLAIAHPEHLPVRNVPVLACRFALDEPIDPDAIAATVQAAFVQADLEEGAAPAALAFRWSGTPNHARLAAVARGIVSALAKTLAAGRPAILLIDGDVAMTLGRIISIEAAPGADVIAIDAVQLEAFDYVDIGAIIQPADVVPVVIKSLLF